MFFSKKKNKKNKEPIQYIQGSFTLDNGMICEYGMTSSGLGVDVYRVKNGKVLFKQLRNFKGQFDNEEMLKVLVESAIIDIDC